MAIPVIMPRQGQSVESCIISKWYKKKGDKVAAGELLFSYETDKASFEEEAKVSGTIIDIFFEEGDDVPVLTNICIIGAEGESSDEFRQNIKSDSSEHQNTPISDIGTQAEQSPVPQHQINEGRTKISPRARNLAEKLGVDARCACPTGPNGRIIEKDIIALQQSGAVFTHAAKDECLKQNAFQNIIGTGIGGRVTTTDLIAKADSVDVVEYEEVKLTNIRKVIAKAMHHSISSTAQLTLNSSFDATDILEFRKKVKEKGESLGLTNITLNDIILYTVSRTLLNHSSLNAHFLDDRIRYFKNVNIGVAVDTERGLMVPTIFNANLKSLNEISTEVKKLVNDCQSGAINPDFLKGGNFTVTNLGALGVESFTPVLNPPQTGILGVCAIVDRVKGVNGQYVFYPAMGLSLTFDHRALDGAPAARFLKDLKNNLENFSLFLVK